MEQIYPDLEWYTALSRAKGCTPRCPFANVHRCPRYYWSYSLLGTNGITTRLEIDVENSVREKWSKSDLWTTMGEEDTGITIIENESRSFNNFCPEVTGKIFGLFASSLSRYSSESDRERAEIWISENVGMLQKDWRWNWRSVDPIHYMDCPTFSLLSVALKPVEITPDR